jgi:5'(3')-deoxyribonucleotidase
MTLYVDLDGVLANFDKAAERQLKTDNIYKFEFVWGPDVFWERMNKNPNFFGALELMPDAQHLWAKIKHMEPVILTALPRENPEPVDQQKRAWVQRSFGGDVKVLTCQTRDKPNYCKPGDILIDDRAVNRNKWIAAGGTYIIHTSAQNTLTTLTALGIIP